MKKLLSWLLSNIDTLIALCIAVIATIWSTFESSSNFLPTLTAISGILGVLAIAIIRDRSSRENLLEEVGNLRKSISDLLNGSTTAESFFFTRTKLTSLADRLKGAQSIDLMGTSLTSLALLHIGTIKELRDTGAKIRVIVSNPENPPLQSFLSMRYLEADTSEIHAAQVRTSLVNLATLIGDRKNKQSFQVRITNHVQTFGYVGIDTPKPSGSIQIELYLDKIPLDRNPIFLIRADKDIHWFNEYKNQFEYLWNEAVDLDTAQYLKPKNKTKR